MNVRVLFHFLLKDIYILSILKEFLSLIISRIIDSVTCVLFLIKRSNNLKISRTKTFLSFLVSLIDENCNVKRFVSQHMEVTSRSH